MSTGRSSKRETHSPISEVRRSAAAPHLAATVFQSDDFLKRRYDLIRRIGQGGMSAVYLAHDRQLDRQVAVKVMRPFSGEGAEDYTARFVQEARLLARLNHPNIVQVYDFAATESGLRIIMEYVDGVTLVQRVRRDGPMGEEEVADVACEVLDALEVIHDQEVVHRDIKPGNVMVDGAGRVKVMDFGIALSGGTDTDASSGAVVGTRKFMAPEQSRAEVITARADLFSLGATMAYMLLGDLPGVLKPEDLPPRLRPVLVRAMASDPAARYESAKEMSAAIRRAIEDPEPANATGRRRLPLALLVAAGTAVGVVLAVLLYVVPEIVGGGAASAPVTPDSTPAPPPTILDEDAADELVIEDEDPGILIEDEVEDPDAGDDDAVEPGGERGGATGGPATRPATPPPATPPPATPPATPPPATEPPATEPAATQPATTEVPEPTIEHERVRSATRGDAVRIVVLVDGPGRYDVQLTYRGVPGGTWRTMDMRHRGGGRYSATLRASGALADGIDYYITVIERGAPQRTWARGSMNRAYYISVE